MTDPTAKRDYAAVHLALARRALGQDVDVPDLDGPVALFDDLDAAVDRHPAGGGAA